MNPMTKWKKDAANRRTSVIDAVGIFLDSMNGVMSKATIKWYRRRLYCLADYVGEDARINSVTIHDLRAWRSSLVDRTRRYVGHPTRSSIDGGLSDETLHGYVRAARRFFSWLEDEEIIKVNPSKRLEFPPRPKRPRAGISDRNAMVMLQAAKKDARDYAILKFINDTACREAGVAGLRLENLDLKKRRAVVYEKGRGGNKKGEPSFFSLTLSEP